MLSGAAKIFRFISSEMSKCGYKVEALIVFDNSIEKNIDNVSVIPLGIKPSPKGVWRLGAIFTLRKAIRKINPNIVCTFVQDACFLVKVATLGLPIRTISCDRGDPSWGGMSIWKPITKWTYRQSDICVFQLPEVRDYFGKENLKKSYVIPNPFVPVANPNMVVRKKTIVSAGRFTDQKGYDVLINAFKVVHDKHPEYELVIYGDGPLKDDYTKQIKRLGLEQNVFLPGAVRNVSSEIKNDGIFVLSSRFEGIPNSLLEAMSMGLPCVSTDCSPGGARFLSDDGKRALIVERDNIKELAQAICKVIEDEQLAEELSNAALTVRETFRPEIILKQWKEVFENCGN